MGFTVPSAGKDLQSSVNIIKVEMERPANIEAGVVINDRRGSRDWKFNKKQVSELSSSPVPAT